MLKFGSESDTKAVTAGKPSPRTRDTRRTALGGDDFSQSPPEGDAALKLGAVVITGASQIADCYLTHCCLSGRGAITPVPLVPVKVTNPSDAAADPLPGNEPVSDPRMTSPSVLVGSRPWRGSVFFRSPPAGHRWGARGREDAESPATRNGPPRLQRGWHSAWLSACACPRCGRAHCRVGGTPMTVRRTPGFKINPNSFC
jgi:hypothetical protein